MSTWLWPKIRSPSWTWNRAQHYLRCIRFSFSSTSCEEHVSCDHVVLSEMWNLNWVSQLWTLTGWHGSASPLHHSWLWCVVSSYCHYTSDAAPHAGDCVRPLPRGVLRPSQLILAVQLDWQAGRGHRTLNGRRTSWPACTRWTYTTGRGLFTLLTLF